MFIYFVSFNIFLDTFGFIRRTLDFYFLYKDNYFKHIFTIIIIMFKIFLIPIL